MIIQLTEKEAEMLNKYNNLLYQIQYETSTGFFYCLDNMVISEIKKIWPNKQIKFINEFKGVSLEEQIEIQLDQVLNSEEFKKTVLDLYEEDHGSNVANSLEFDKIINTTQFG